jgi:uncharacterized protein (TIGR02996 family)
MPWLEVLSSAIPDYAAGQRVELPHDFRRVVIKEAAGGWRAIDNRPSAGLRLNGSSATQATRPLEHGDVLEPLTGFCVAFREHEQPRPKPHELERAIAEAPHDGTLWNVWADWLAEQADPRAELVRELRIPDVFETARRLGPLARPWRNGTLELAWRRGFIESARLRPLGEPLLPSTQWCLERLLEHEAAAFIERVDVDGYPAQTPLVRNLGRAPASLRRFTLGMAPAGTVLDAPQDGRVEVALATFTRCMLRTDDAAIEVTAERTRLLSPVYVELHADGLWLDTDGAGAVVNHQACMQARLLHGDVIELGARRWTVVYV